MNQQSVLLPSRGETSSAIVSKDHEILEPFSITSISHNVNRSGFGKFTFGNYPMRATKDKFFTPSFFLATLIVLSAPLMVYRLPISSLVTLSIAKTAIILAALYYLARFSIGKQILLDSTSRIVGLGFLVLLSQNLLMTLYSSNHAYAFKMIGLQASNFVIFLVVSWGIRNDRQIVYAVYALATTWILVLTFGLYQIISFVTVGEIPLIPFIDYLSLPHEQSKLFKSFIWYIPGVFPRVSSLLAEVNTLGIYLGLLMIISINVRLDKTLWTKIQQGRLGKFFSITAYTYLIPGSVLLLTLSLSRSGILSFLLGGLLLSLSASTKVTIQMILTILLLASLIMVGLNFFYPEIIEILAARYGVGETAGHINVRLEAFNFLNGYTILTGLGFGDYGLVAGNQFGVSSTHTYYLTYFIEGGILGLLAIGFFSLQLLISARNLGKKTNRRLNLSMVVVLVLIFNNLMYHTLWFEFIWVLLAICYAIDRISTQNGNHTIEQSQSNRHYTDFQSSALHS